MSSSLDRVEKQIISLAKRGSLEKCGPLMLLRCAAILFVREAGGNFVSEQVEFMKTSFELKVEMQRLLHVGDNAGVLALTAELDAGLAEAQQEVEEELRAQKKDGG